MIGGVLVCVAAVALEKAKIDDAVGAAPVHLDQWHLGRVGRRIFANGNPDTALWNGIETPVTGLLYGGTGQFVAQVFEVVAVGGTVFISSFIFFKILSALKVLRVSREVELEGLDGPEMGSYGYPKDFEPEPGAEVYSRKKSSRMSTGAVAAAGK